MVHSKFPTQVRSANQPNNATFFMCTTIEWINGISWISVTLQQPTPLPLFPYSGKLATQQRRKKTSQDRPLTLPSQRKKQYSFSLSPEPRYASSQLGGLLPQKMTKGSCACLHAWFRVIKVLHTQEPSGLFGLYSLPSCMSTNILCFWSCQRNTHLWLNPANSQTRLKMSIDFPKKTVWTIHGRMKHNT